MSTRRPLTPGEIERIKEEGISFDRGEFLEGVRLFRLTRDKDKNVLYYDEDLSEGTGWLDDIVSEEIILANLEEENYYLQLKKSDGEIRYYYMSDLSQHTDWLDNVADIKLDTIEVNNIMPLIITQQKTTTFEPKPRH